MDNLLLSFPRSGNTWIRYVLEYVSKRPTSMGTILDCQEGINKTDTLTNLTGSDVNKKCIAIKRHDPNHDWDNWTKDNTNIVFLLRDWREACLRHLIPQQRRDVNEIQRCADEYVSCLRFFDTFDGNKILVNYEDIIISPRSSIDKIIDFLNVDKNEHYSEFWNNYESHKEKSVISYEPGSSTRGQKTLLKFHSRRAPANVIRIIDNVVKGDKSLYDRYLKRYE